MYLHVYNIGMEPVHLAVLDGARTLATERSGWTFRIADLVHLVPHLNPGTVRTHIASRCCVNAPSHHQSRHPYFRAIGRGIYRIEPAFRRGPGRQRPSPAGWQDRLLASLDTGIDPSLIAESLKLTPTERLEGMRTAAQSLDHMTLR